MCRKFTSSSVASGHYLYCDQRNADTIYLKCFSCSSLSYGILKCHSTILLLSLTETSVTSLAELTPGVMTDQNRNNQPVSHLPLLEKLLKRLWWGNSSSFLMPQIILTLVNHLTIDLDMEQEPQWMRYLISNGG